ncbi:hypothetical protein VTN00DRAFT_4450 [Thermoascus crustaceus]|uniref:uncharacterized protein n=1 Tax=Thermoascus crustaceus TaxID=5088 RepID=UPI003742CFAE
MVLAAHGDIFTTSFFAISAFHFLSKEGVFKGNTGIGWGQVAIMIMINLLRLSLKSVFSSPPLLSLILCTCFRSLVSGIKLPG